MGHGPFSSLLRMRVGLRGEAVFSVCGQTMDWIIVPDILIIVLVLSLYNMYLYNFEQYILEAGIRLFSRLSSASL